MGLVSNQAYSNTLNIVIGFTAGAINTIIVLPRVFEETLDDWGLLKLILSFAVILSPIFGFGVNNIIIRELSGDRKRSYAENILGFSLIIALLGSILVSLFVSLGGLKFFINDRDALLLSQNVIPLLVLTISIILGQVFSGYITAKHKTPIIQFVNDSFLKIAYLSISLYYLFNPMNFELFLTLYVGTYAMALVIYIVYSLRIGFKAKFDLSSLSIKPLLNYGFYTVLDKGAAIIVSNLDLIMIAYILALSDVAIYGLAFFIAAVIIIPQKALMLPSYPLVSAALKNEKMDELAKLYRQSSINQIVIGGVLFILIWTNIDSIFNILPEKFAEGKWIVFYIGISRLFILSTGVSGPIIVFSKYFRVNLIFNFFLVGLTILSNYFLIHQFQLVGAAMATAITYLAFSILKAVYIQNKFKIQPFTIQTIKTILIIIVIGFIGDEIEIPLDNDILSIIIKSILVGLLMTIAFYGLRVKAEILELPIKMIRRFFN